MLFRSFRLTAPYSEERREAAGDDKAARGYATVVTTLFADPALVAAAEKILKSLPSEK